MSNPNVAVVVEDGGLGIIAATAENVYVAIGAATSGPTNTIVPISSQKSLISTFGSGPLVEAVAVAFSDAAAQGIGITVLCLVPTTTAGTNSAVTQVGAGTSVMTVTGTPVDLFSVIVTIVVAGTEGTPGAQMTYSLDGGITTSAPVVIPTAGTYQIPGTGLTLNFAAGTFIAGNTYSFTSAAPTYSSGQLVTALAALAAYNTNGFRFIHVIGPAASVSAAASLQSTMDTQMTALAGGSKWARAIIECPSDTDANIEAAFLGIYSKRVAVAVGFATTVSPISGLQRSRSSAWKAVGRAIATPLHEDLGRVATGPLPGVTAISRDETATPGLFGAGFITLQTITGLEGFYYTGGPLRSPPGSDFMDLEHGFVMDEATTLSYLAGLHFLNDTVRVNPSTATPPGAIDTRDAESIEKYIEQQVRPVLVGGDNPYGKQDASDFQVAVDTTANVLSTSKIPITIRVIPLGYDHFIAIDIGFLNPSLAS